jgi:hypothetical protein
MNNQKEFELSLDLGKKFSKILEENKNKYTYHSTLAFFLVGATKLCKKFNMSSEDFKSMMYKAAEDYENL